MSRTSARRRVLSAIAALIAATAMVGATTVATASSAQAGCCRSSF